MKNLFIDTNIWLSMYHFSNDDLNKFEKLKEYLGKAIKLYFPSQVWDEFLRNREAKLKDSLKDFEMKAMQYPVFCREYDEFAEFNESYKKLLSSLEKWKRNIYDNIEQRTLPADQTIRSVIELAEWIECDPYVGIATARYQKGNPPGKDNKYGDAINWECLLASVPEGEDLYFISADKDYMSAITKNKMNSFLLLEWEKKKKSKIYFYTSLTDYFRENLQEMHLTLETDKQDLIKELRASANFITTHGVIAMMKKYTDWNETQIEEICSAAENNTQVGWILSDEDVQEFYCKLLSNIDIDNLDDSSTKRIIKGLNKKGLLLNSSSNDNGGDNT